MAKNEKLRDDFQYDVVLSFAGEDRRYVHKVAVALVRKGIRVFFDEYERVELWGKDLHAHLDDIYQNVAYYCVMFVSRHFKRKLWTNHERRSAQARAFRENREYILPARFDKTAVPGIPDTIGYVDLRKIQPNGLADMIAKKLGPRTIVNFLPPDCDHLYRSLRARNLKQRHLIQARAQLFATALERMTDDERRVLLLAFYHCCVVELPENVHVSLDILHRCTRFSIPKIKRLLTGMVSLGIGCRFSASSHHTGASEGEMAYIEFDIRQFADFRGNATHVAHEMVFLVKRNYCEDHGVEVLLRRDFSQLSSATAREHKHEAHG